MLSLKKLQGLLIDNFNSIRDNGGSEKESADGMAGAIVDYVEDLEATIPTPFTIPGVPPIPDPSVIGRKVPISGHTAGKTVLSKSIQASYKAQDPTLNLIGTAISTYVATLITFSTPPPTPPLSINGVSTIAPVVLAPVTPIGMAGGEIEDVMKVMAGIIHTSFMAGTISGVGTNLSAGATIPTPVVAKFI